MANPVTPDLASSALNYHRSPRPGKLEIQATKPLGTQHDLALAYSPGVAAACLAIAADPAEAAELTIRQNLVAVVTNGTAVLGLGNIGPLAAKPVMEGKAVLFKKFAGIDVFDIEIAENDIDKLVDIVASLEPTFGGINLEDIKAPQCFEVERKLRERMSIPVFHDDQHGTAIIVAAAVLNAMELSGKTLFGRQDRQLRRGRGGARLHRFSGRTRGRPRKHLHHRHRRRRLQGPRRDERAHGGLRAGHQRAPPRRRDRRRRYVRRSLAPAAC